MSFCFPGNRSGYSIHFPCHSFCPSKTLAESLQIALRMKGSSAARRVRSSIVNSCGFMLVSKSVTAACSKPKAKVVRDVLTAPRHESERRFGTCRRLTPARWGQRRPTCRGFFAPDFESGDLANPKGIPSPKPRVASRRATLGHGPQSFFNPVGVASTRLAGEATLSGLCPFSRAVPRVARAALATLGFGAATPLGLERRAVQGHHRCGR